MFKKFFPSAGFQVEDVERCQIGWVIAPAPSESEEGRKTEKKK